MAILITMAVMGDTVIAGLHPESSFLHRFMLTHRWWDMATAFNPATDLSMVMVHRASR